MSEMKHNHIHSQEDYKRMIDRISRIIGHASAIKTMMEEHRDCPDILVQISAVQSALNSLGKYMLKDHIDQCVVHALVHADEQEREQSLKSLNQAIDQFIR